MALQFRRATANQNCSRADGSLLDISSALTISAWVKLNSLPSVAGDQFGILGKGLTGTDLAYYFFFETTNQLRVRLSTNGTSNTNLTGSTVFLTGAWRHVAMTWNGSTIRLYVDGVEEASSASFSGTLFNSSSVLRVGSRSDQADDADMDMEDVRIYDRALSGTEIDDLFDDLGKDHVVTDTIPTGGVARWPLRDAASGTASGADSVKDVWPNALHLTPNNSPTYGAGTTTVDYGASPQETVSLSEGQASATAFVGALSETVSLSESAAASAAYATSPSETVTLSESEGSSAGAEEALPESVSLAEAGDALVANLAPLEEEPDLEESQDSLAAYLVGMSESASVVEDVLAEGGNNPVEPLDETVSVAEAVASLYQASASLQEHPMLMESVNTGESWYFHGGWPVRISAYYPTFYDRLRRFIMARGRPGSERGAKVG